MWSRKRRQVPGVLSRRDEMKVASPESFRGWNAIKKIRPVGNGMSESTGAFTA